MFPTLVGQIKSPLRLAHPLEVEVGADEIHCLPRVLAQPLEYRLSLDHGCVGLSHLDIVVKHSRLHNQTHGVANVKRESDGWVKAAPFAATRMFVFARRFCRPEKAYSANWQCSIIESK